MAIRGGVAAPGVGTIRATAFASIAASLLGLVLAVPSAALDPDAVEIALSHLHARSAALGLASGDLDEIVVTDLYDTPRIGTTHVYLRQQLDGIDVHGAEVSIAVDARGRAFSVGDRLVRGLRSRPAASLRGPSLSAEDALLAAARHLGLEASGPPTRRAESGGSQPSIVFEPSGLSRNAIPAQRVYVALDGGSDVRLAWNLAIRTPDGRHWWSLYVDAASGRVLRQVDWIHRDSLNVFPLPLTSPDEGPRALIGDVADAAASPFGWYDLDGVAGADHTDTRGNNVFAQEDVDGDDLGGTRPDGGPSLVFDFPVDFDDQPGNYIGASVTSLFYWNNIAHDVMYRYGFDEPAGNFQQNNYGNGGSALDAVIADAQDGSDVNNAQMAVPPDGFAPIMDMFRWIQLQLPPPQLVVTTPPTVAGTYFAGRGLFGAGTLGLSDSIVRAIDPSDGAGPSTTDGCSPLTNGIAVTGNIAILDRGTCTFVEKVGNAQAAGAIGAIIVDNVAGPVIDMAGIDPSITIPSIFLSQSDGQTIIAQLGLGVQGSLVTPAARDSSFDSGVVVHEYGHGVSTRLTAGPSNVSCLSAPESDGMGEGWSDFWALVFTAESSDLDVDERGVAAYLVDAPPNGGIRNYPYSTDLVSSPLTYADISGLDQPHGIGEVWGGALWQMYWNLVGEYGFDPDLYAGSGGNNLALELVMDGLKLQPCDPTFVEGRDAILAADATANGGANQCLIWEAFAKRGIGEGASDGGSANVLTVVESFDVPIACPEPDPTLLAACALLSAIATRRFRGSVQHAKP